MRRFFYIQSHVFLYTLSRNIKFHCIAAVEDRSKKTQLQYINGAVELYHNRGFRVNHIIADSELQCIKDDMRPIHVETVAKDDHVADIERGIRQFKNGVRGTIQSLPYQRYPKIMLHYLITDTLKPMKFNPATDGISDHISPLTMVTGQGAPDYKQMKIEFGAYAQVFEEN